MPFTKTHDQDLAGRYRYFLPLERMRDPAVVLGFICGLVGLYANIFNLPLTFETGGGGGVTTPLTLVAVILLGMSIAGRERRNGLMPMAPYCAGFAAFFAVLPHLAEVLGFGPIQGQVIAGRLGLDTSVVIVLLALAVVLRYRATTLGLAAGFGASACVLNGVIGQTYGLPYFDGDMALMTLVALSFLTFGTMTLFFDRPIVRVVFISSAIGLRTRMMMGVGFFVPWACGLLLYRVYGVPERGFPVEATLITVIICIMLAVTLASGFLHEKADHQRRLTEEKLERMALHDPLTGLKNRAGIGMKMTQAWDRFHRSKVPAAVMLIDLDHFKTINDTFGHDVGDLVLKAVRDVLQPHLRKGDVVGRWGGEEFLCLLNNTDLRHLHVISERLRMALATISKLPQLAHGKGEVPVSGSIGVSAFIKGDLGYAAAIKRADEALYAAKRAGRNRVIFDPSMRPAQPKAPRMRGNALTA